QILAHDAAVTRSAPALSQSITAAAQPGLRKCASPLAAVAVLHGAKAAAQRRGIHLWPRTFRQDPGLSQLAVDERHSDRNAVAGESRSTGAYRRACPTGTATSRCSADQAPCTPDRLLSAA